MSFLHVPQNRDRLSYQWFPRSQPAAVRRADPLGLVFSSHLWFKWKGGIGKLGRGDGRSLCKKGMVTVVRLSTQPASNANAILSHVVCTVGVLIFHDFSVPLSVGFRTLLLPSCAVWSPGGPSRRRE